MTVSQPAWSGFENAHASALRDVVSAWLTAWKERDLASYIDRYSPRFRSGGRDLSALRAYKARIFEGAGPLEIELSNTQMADILERVVAIERIGARSVRATADDMLTLFRHFLTIITMAGTVY